MLTRVHSSGRTCGLYPPNEHRAGCAFPHSASVTSSNLANVHTNRQQKHSTNIPLLPPKHTLPPPLKHSPSSVLSACDILPPQSSSGYSTSTLPALSLRFWPTCPLPPAVRWPRHFPPFISVIKI